MMSQMIILLIEFDIHWLYVRDDLVALTLIRIICIIWVTGIMSVDSATIDVAQLTVAISTLETLLADLRLPLKLC